jgi:hypothetical protein
LGIGHHRPCIAAIILSLALAGKKMKMKITFNFIWTLDRSAGGVNRWMGPRPSKKNILQPPTQLAGA